MQLRGKWRAAGLLLWAGLWSGLAQEQKPQPPATLAELQQRISNHISQPKFAGAFWGIDIVSLDTGKTLFECNAHKLFSPASNCKLYTVALALDRLGADYRIKTSLYAKTKPTADGTLEGDLVIYGRGDPTINARLHGGNIYNALQPLVAALTNAGVRRIRGDLIGDDSYFRGPELGSGWMWDDAEYYYGAEVSALTFNDNTLEIRVKPGEKTGAPCKISLSPATGWLIFSNRTETVAATGKRSLQLYRPLGENVVYVTGHMALDDTGYTDLVPFHDPAGLFASFFEEALARHGITVEGKARSMHSLDRQAEPINCHEMMELGAVESLPMSAIAREVQKPSQNLYADLLLAQVGERARKAETAPETTSEELGLAELKKFFAQAGIPKGEAVFFEGSGLGRDNLASPNATVTLLRYMAKQRCAQPYLDALPIAGVDGTLKARMQKTPAQGNLRAKTGTLQWANSLSGHVTTAAGEHVVFSLMLNRYYELQRSRGDLDTIAVLLAGFTGRSAE